MSDEMSEDMIVFGLEDELENVPTESELGPRLYEIWPDNQKALAVFMALSTQWDVVVDDGELVRTRIMYEVFDTTISKINGIARREWSQLFDDVRCMERAALKALNEERRERRQRQADERAWSDCG